MKVKLEEIIEAMEFADMETEYYYDTKKDKLYDLNLEQQWYSYKDSAYERIASKWCERYGIEVEE